MDNTIAATSTTGTQTTKKAASQTMDKNAFLQLLVAQLKNQDPNQAQDSMQMVQQMTSFASLEQMQNMNSALQGIQVQNVGLFQAQASNLVGKQVKINSDSFQLLNGKGSVGVELPADAKVTVNIVDANGKVVRTLNQGDMKAGSHMVNWDGRDADGKQLKDGAYTVQVSAMGAGGKAVVAGTTAFARVETVIFEGSNVFVIAGGKRYSLADISEIAA